MGKKKQPSYRVVAADSRKARNGRFIEIVGTYNPRQEPSLIEIDNERALHWLRHGAQPSERVQKLLVISGAWAEFTGEAGPAAAPPAMVTTAASAEAADTAPEGEPIETAEEPEAASAEIAEEPEAASAEIAEEPEAASAEIAEEPEAASTEGDEGPEEDAEKVEDGES